MASSKNETPAVPAFVRPAAFANLAEKYPIYDGGDARTAKPGAKGAPVNGYFLGSLELPGTQADSDGVVKPWFVFVIELLQPAPAAPPGKDAAGDDFPTRWYLKGERIAVTMSAALERYEPIGNDKARVHEVLIEPEVSKNKKGQPLWVYPTFGIVSSRARDEKKDMVSMLGVQLSAAGILTPGTDSTPKLLAANGSTATPAA